MSIADHCPCLLMEKDPDYLFKCAADLCLINAPPGIDK
jgi:hypothetical protein